MVVAVLTCGLIICSGNGAAAAVAIATSPLGEWEVTRVLVTRGMQPQWSMREDDPRLMGRTLYITPETVHFRNADTGCALSPMAAASRVPINVLFAKGGTVAGRRPASMRGALYGRPENYELGAVSKHPVSLLQLKCKLDYKFPVEANWFARTIGALDILLVPYQPDALLLLRRPLANFDQKSTIHAQYCQPGIELSDKAICGDRQLLQMYDYTITARARAQSSRPEVNDALESAIAEQVKRRLACGSDKGCLYDVLDRHIEALVQRW